MWSCTACWLLETAVSALKGVSGSHNTLYVCWQQEQIRVLTQRKMELAATEEASKASPEEQKQVCKQCVGPASGVLVHSSGKSSDTWL